MTWFDWYEAKVDRIRETTSSVDGAEKKTPETPLEHVRRCLGSVEAEAIGDARPVLVFFHWPHEDPVNGKVVESLCCHALDDEETARWGLLFRCVQVDMSSSDPKYVALIGAKDKPEFAVFVKGAAEPVARIPALQHASKLSKALKDALAKAPDAQKELDRALAEQDKALLEAKAAMKADKLDDAKAAYDRIRISKVRVGPQFNRALVEGTDVDQRIERAKTR